MTKRERFNQSEPDIILNQRVRAAHQHDRWLEPPAEQARACCCVAGGGAAAALSTPPRMLPGWRSRPWWRRRLRGPGSTDSNWVSVLLMVSS